MFMDISIYRPRDRDRDGRVRPHTGDHLMSVMDGRRAVQRTNDVQDRWFRDIN